MNPTWTSLNLAIPTASRGAKRGCNAAAAALAVVLCVGLSACDRPPFDVTGTYHGTWEWSLFGDDDPVVCPLTLTLDEDVAWYECLVGANVAGTASFDALCFLPEPLARLFEYNSLDAAVLGEAHSGGTIEVHSGACLDPQSFCAVLRLDGLGTDTNRDKMMDVLVGNLRLDIAFAGFDPIDIDATFEVERVYEPPWE